MDTANEVEPPGAKDSMGVDAGYVPAPGAVARRSKGLWQLWCRDWNIPLAGNLIRGRYRYVPGYFQGK